MDSVTADAIVPVLQEAVRIVVDAKGIVTAIVTDKGPNIVAAARSLDTVEPVRCMIHSVQLVMKDMPGENVIARAVDMGSSHKEWRAHVPTRWCSTLQSIENIRRKRSALQASGTEIAVYDEGIGFLKAYRILGRILEQDATSIVYGISLCFKMYCTQSPGMATRQRQLCS